MVTIRRRSRWTGWAGRTFSCAKGYSPDGIVLDRIRWRYQQKAACKRDSKEILRPFNKKDESAPSRIPRHSIRAVDECARNRHGDGIAAVGQRTARLPERPEVRVLGRCFVMRTNRIRREPILEASSPSRQMSTSTALSGNAIPPLILLPP